MRRSSVFILFLLLAFSVVPSLGQSTSPLTDDERKKALDYLKLTREWILFMAAHSERHTAQILEVKADPKFPKKKSGY